MNKKHEIIRLLKRRKNGIGKKTLAEWLDVPLPEVKRLVLHLQIDGLITVDNRGVMLTKNVIETRDRKTYFITERGHIAISLAGGGQQ